MSTAIEFDHVSKQYRLGLVSTKTLSHDIRRFWITNILHKEDPYLKIGEVNDRSVRGSSDYVWALRDIDFKVEQGDVVGIIGKNGAGKSTLLKLLSRVTGPTTGTIRAHGRIGSLLEVGTGFHGEMTGRENIFMNGAILGMTRHEIQAKLDEIIDFSGCERYIDTPVKRYSSGMTVRLGFAVAAFLEPEILVVDEVLAVGDAEFQKKAIGKMKDVSQGQGRTVLFVSHNMASIRQLCTRGILLDKGMVSMDAGVNEVVDAYLLGQKGLDDFMRIGTGEVRFKDVTTISNGINLGDDFIVDFTLEANRDIKLLNLSFDIRDETLSQVCHVTDLDAGFQIKNLRKGEVRKVRCVWKNVNFAPGSYVANIWCGDPYNCYDYIEECIRFYVNQGETFILKETPYDSSAKVVLQSDWQILK